MDAVITAVSAAISNVGFPIVAVGAMFWLVNKQDDTRKQESEKWAEAINNNTLAITKLCDKLEGVHFDR